MIYNFCQNSGYRVIYIHVISFSSNYMSKIKSAIVSCKKALIRFFLFAFRRILSREVTAFFSFFIRNHGNNICFLKAVEPHILLLILIERKEELYIKVFDMVCFVFMWILCYTMTAKFDWFWVFRQSDSTLFSMAVVKYK